jgi:hypothetical protein
MRRIRLTSALLPAFLLTTTLALANSWHTSKLLDTERQEITFCCFCGGYCENRGAERGFLMVDSW